MYKCVIIEDESVAARRLEKMLKNQDFDVLAILNSIEESVEWFLNNPEPDIIFLDVQLGDGISFEIFETVQPQSSIIFTTAYDNYALKAFEFNSIDYLLKPIHKDDLSRAIAKITAKKHTPTSIDYKEFQNIINQSFDSRYRNRFLIKIGAKYKTIETEGIQCFYSQDKTTHLFANGRDYIMEKSLDQLINELNPQDFFKVSRQAIVQLPYITDIVSYSGSRLKLIIKEAKQEFVVSREKVSDFKQWIDS